MPIVKRMLKVPKRFKFCLKDDFEFVYSLFVDIFYIDNHPVLQVGDGAKHYQSDRWLSTVPAEVIWRALRMF